MSMFDRGRRRSYLMGRVRSGGLGLITAGGPCTAEMRALR